MIRPQRNRYRNYLELDGLWRFRADPDDVGETEGWANGVDTWLDVAVPGSWNEQLAEAGLMNYTGAAWLFRDVFVPETYADQKLILRFGSADFRAIVWANGAAVGESNLPYMPFECDVTGHAIPGETLRVAVKVTNLFDYDWITPAISSEDFERENRLKDEVFPATRPDFFPYGGLHRPVKLLALPKRPITAWEIETDIQDGAGKVVVRTHAEGGDGVSLVLKRRGETVAQARLAPLSGVANLIVDAPDLWSPDCPALYELTAFLEEDGEIVDAVSQLVGIRTIKVVGASLLLNGERIFLRGFGKHEDAPISGRALNLPFLVKDFGLMRWINANSFRTSHYPYAEEMLDYADRHGFLVVSELASVNLDFRIADEQTLANHKRALEAQIARDRNHPCVIMWCLANEPGYLGEAEYNEENAGLYWDALTQKARDLDKTRPLTTANVQYAGVDDPAFSRVDVIGLNRYHGWYNAPGQIERGAEMVRKELDVLHRNHAKPIIMFEFGADALHGEHSTTDQLFTEEYQENFLAAYCDLLENHPACVGEHVWNFADFRTSQHFRRVVLNRKGVFTRDRRPKRAAFMLRDRWGNLKKEGR